MTIRKWIQFEYVVSFVMLFVVYLYLEFPVWLFFLLLLLPDLSILGYLVNGTIGTTLYNFVHHLSLPTIIIILIILLDSMSYLAFPIIWIAHILLDGALGYGLKYKESFKETHLQKIL